MFKIIFQLKYKKKLIKLEKIKIHLKLFEIIKINYNSFRNKLSSNLYKWDMSQLFYPTQRLIGHQNIIKIKLLKRIDF